MKTLKIAFTLKLVRIEARIDWSHWQLWEAPMSTPQAHADVDIYAYCLHVHENSFRMRPSMSNQWSWFSPHFETQIGIEYHQSLKWVHWEPAGILCHHCRIHHRVHWSWQCWRKWYQLLGGFLNNVHWFSRIQPHAWEWCCGVTSQSGFSRFGLSACPWQTTLNRGNWAGNSTQTLCWWSRPGWSRWKCKWLIRTSKNSLLSVADLDQVLVDDHKWLERRGD